jgi:hypothetical protein
MEAGISEASLLWNADPRGKQEGGDDHHDDDGRQRGVVGRAGQGRAGQGRIGQGGGRAGAVTAANGAPLSAIISASRLFWQFALQPSALLLLLKFLRVLSLLS